MASIAMSSTRYRTRYFTDADATVRENVVFEIEDGRFSSVDCHGTWDVDLGDSLVIPGLVNAHSHAFQRSIRGRTEWLNVSRADDDFWSWRDQMYSAALTLDDEALYSASRLAFDEMAASGVTTVGEFHYIHHRPDGTPYANRNELAQRVIEAALDAGLRITLLLVAYNRGGHNRAAEPKQRRFIEQDIEVFLERVENLQTRYRDDERVRIGVAPHSIRAVPMEWLKAIAEWAAPDTPIHIHACEQRREIEEAHEEHGLSPIGIIKDSGLLENHLTLIHATHLDESDLQTLENSDVGVCACPTTERNLGDGFLPAAELVKRGVPISLGSDSHTNIDLFEEMRLVEYHERLRHEQRNVLASVAWESGRIEARDGKVGSDRILWPMATTHGARALGFQDLGRLEVGAMADFAVVDTRHISLSGADADSLMSDVVFSMPWTCVRQTWVAGGMIYNRD